MDRYELAAAVMGAPYVPIGSGPLVTAEQVKRAAACEKVTQGKRRFAKYKIINEQRRAAVSQTERNEVNCASCTHCHSHNAERQIGWCYQLRFRVSTWHPIYCNGFKPA